MIVSSILPAIGLFIVTNIDDIIVLSLFFARGAGQRPGSPQASTWDLRGSWARPCS